MQVTDHLRVAHYHAQAPACHVVGLRQRIEFHRHVLCARNLQNAGGFVVVEADVHVGGVVGDDDLMFAGKFNRFLKEFEGGDRAGGVVGIIEPEQFRAPGDIRQGWRPGPAGKRVLL